MLPFLSKKGNMLERTATFIILKQIFTCENPQRKPCKREVFLLKPRSESVHIGIIHIFLSFIFNIYIENFFIVKRKNY